MPSNVPTSLDEPVLKMLFRPNRHLTLANFQLHPGNQHARSYALSLAQGSPRKHRPLLIVAGQSGRGKTHLIHAVANFAKQNDSIDSRAVSRGVV